MINKIIKKFLATTALSSMMLFPAARAELIVIQPIKQNTESTNNIIIYDSTTDPLRQELARMQLENDRLRSELNYRNQQVLAVYTPENNIQTETIPVFGNTAKFKLSANTKNNIITRAKSAQSITITGYTDSTGNNAINRKVGLARANAFKKFLVKNGVSAKKIRVDSKLGNYIATNKTSAGRAANRRVVVSYTN